MQLLSGAETQTAEAKQTDSYQLIVFNSIGTAVLLESSEAEYCLPKIEIPKFSRPAQEVTTALRNVWGLSSVFLFSEMMESDLNGNYFAVLESRHWLGTLPQKMEWFAIDHSVSGLSLPPEQRRVLNLSYKKAVNRKPGVNREPFARLGWMRDLEDWIRGIVGPQGTELRDFKQFNGSESFSLLRFETTNKPVWFKATGNPNLHELPITLALSRLFPDCLPPVLGSSPQLNGWLMASAGDTTLGQVQDVTVWRSAMSCFANLQARSVGHVTSLLEAGCRDLRIQTLAGLIDPFLDVMARLMERQTKNPPAPLTRLELSSLASTLKHAFLSLGESGIPDALGHTDLNAGNIIVDGNQYVFVDWAEAHISFPFITFEYFLAHFRKTCPALVDQEHSIREAYELFWIEKASANNVRHALSLSPLVAAYAYAISGNTWRDPESLNDPKLAGYLRALTRRMKKEADSLRLGRDS